MSENNTNWGQSVAAVVIHDGKVLLARHTYGGGKGLLITPGGDVDYNETPQDAVKREYREETGVLIEPRDIIAVRFNMHDWYIVFSADYIGGNAHSDNDENSEVVWVDTAEALARDDVAELSKSLIKCALQGRGMKRLPYSGNPKNGEASLYG
ncbi:MAG: NUDIX hydrolase [Acutalibacteraceae bacterium]|nr:NUDIX hydrolase [Acutalibacteraceae bacterium]